MCFEGFAGVVDGRAMGKVAAMGKVEAQDSIARLEERQENGGIGLRAGVGLYIRVSGTEEFLQAVDGQLFNLVNDFTAAVVATTRVALGIFVGQAAARGIHDGPAGKVFGGY
jgi:hypothetical protein